MFMIGFWSFLDDCEPIIRGGDILLVCHNVSEIIDLPQCVGP